MGNVTSKLIEAYAEVNEKKKLDPVGQADADIDNDGDVDKSDKYLHNRRKAVKKAMKDDEMKEAYESYGENVIKAAKMYMKDNSCTYEMAAEKYGCSAEQVKKCASEMYKKEEVEESTKSALAKKLAKASAPSEKGKKAVTLKKAPWEKNEANNDEEIVMNPKKDKNKKADAETMNTESVNLDEDLTHQTVKPPSHTKKYSGKDSSDTNSIGGGGNKSHTVTSSQADAHDKTAAHHNEVADAHTKAGEKASSPTLQRLHHQASVHHKKAAEAHFNASHSSSGADKDSSIQKSAKDMHMSYHLTMHANKMSQEARNKGTKAKRMNNENVLPPVYARILEEREKHYKGATKPEGMMDNSKSSKGAMDMVNQPKEINDDDEKGHEDASKAGRVGPSAKARPADNMKGDKKVIPSATPMKGK